MFALTIIMSSIALLGIIVCALMWHAHMKYHAADLEHSASMDRRIEKLKVSSHALAFMIEDIQTATPQGKADWDKAISKFIEVAEGEPMFQLLYDRKILQDYCNCLKKE